MGRPKQEGPCWCQEGNLSERLTFKLPLFLTERSTRLFIQFGGIHMSNLKHPRIHVWDFPVFCFFLKFQGILAFLITSKNDLMDVGQNMHIFSMYGYKSRNLSYFFSNVFHCGFIFTSVVGKVGIYGVRQCYILCCMWLSPVFLQFSSGCKIKCIIRFINYSFCLLGVVCYFGVPISPRHHCPSVG